MKMTHVKRMMLEARREYEQRQGYDIDDKSRLSHFVQDRVALANAFRPYSTYRSIGEVFGKDVKGRNLHNELTTIKRTIRNLKLFQKKIETKLGIAHLQS